MITNDEHQKFEQNITTIVSYLNIKNHYWGQDIKSYPSYPIAIFMLMKGISCFQRGKYCGYKQIEKTYPKGMSPMHNVFPNILCLDYYKNGVFCGKKDIDMPF